MLSSPHRWQLVTTRHLNCYGVAVCFFCFFCISIFLFSSSLNLIMKCVPYSAEISHLAVGCGEGISLLVSDWLSQLSLR